MAITQSENDRPQKRGHWTIKSSRLDEETANLFRLAAKKANLPLGHWAVEALREAALRQLGKLAAPAEADGARLPALPGDVADQIRKVAEELAAANAASEQRMALMVSEAAVAAEALVERLTEKLDPVDQQRQLAHQEIKASINGALDKIARQSRWRRWR